MSFPDNKSYNGYPGIDKNLGRPWFGMNYESTKYATYNSDVRPLTAEDWAGITEKGQPLTGLGTHSKKIIRQNRAILAKSDTVTVVLDGRVNIFSQGYLGDLVEATRIIDPLLENGKHVRIVTSHTDIFGGAESNKLEVKGISSDIPPANHYPWDQRLLRYIGQAAAGSPVIFPVNARVPLAFEIDKQGEIKNGDIISVFNRMMNQSDKQVGIRHEKWAKRGVHQLQALQGFSHLLGFDSLGWDKFPEAFFYPDSYSVKVADEVINYYHCFYSTNNDKPLLLHPGVATDGRKVALKGYPEEKWKAAITKISTSSAPVSSITMLKPVDQDQAMMATRLIKHAERVGFNVSEVPMEDINRKYGWSFGSFISFLQELSMRNGIILGCDSMPAGHAGPAAHLKAVVLGSPFFNPTFFGPAEKSLVVMPKHDYSKSEGLHVKTVNINASQIGHAVESIMK
jgi:hypothetical protein